MVMMESVAVRESISDISTSVKIPTLSICPYCHTEISHHKVFITPFYEKDTKRFAILFECLRCHDYFVVTYRWSSDFCDYSHEAIYQPIDIPRLPPLHTDIPKNIEEHFPEFKVIYEQSFQAESLGLTAICGMGFRKALEFLVKSYSISKAPDEKQKIKSETLSQSINRLDEKLKILAKAISWIGNDETHYVRKWENKDVTDMKQFISALMSFISAEITYDDAIQMIESKSSNGS